MKTTCLKLITAFIFISVTSCNKEENIQPVNEITTKSIDERMSLQIATANQENFILGINGHPLNSAPYIKTSADKQIELIKTMGMSYYRFDVVSMSDGGITVPYLFNPLNAAAITGNIKLLPVLNTRTLDINTDTITSYNLGKTLGSNFAGKYGQHFDYYELGKELENKCILSGISGTSTAHYDLKKYKIIAAYLKGMDEGIKSKDANAKTIINATWLHYGYIQLLEQSGVNFDVLGWHWYSNQESLAAKSPYNIPDISLKLSSISDKPLWFTELRVRKTSSGSEQDQDAFITNFIAKCRNNARVKAVLVYELFDEPEKGSTEGNYGMIKWVTRYTDWQYTIAANSFIAAKPVETPPLQDSVVVPEIPAPTIPVPEVPEIVNPPATRTNFNFGVNGHPLGTAPYTNTPATTQIELLKSMGMNFYRIDVMSMSDGRITVPYLFNPLKAAADAGGVKLLPMLYSKTLRFDVDATTSYNLGKTLGSNFAEKNGHHFDYYELANELDLKLILKDPNGVTKSGTSPSHYDLQKFNIVAAYLKGMNDGVKSKDPSAKTMVNGNWVHFAYLQMLEDAGVNFDIVAWHWYNEMESLAAKSPYNIPDIGLKLAQLFPDKPIWFTETNIRYKNSSTIEQTRDQYLTKFIDKCKKNPRVHSVMIYELFDEPEKNNILESNYGIIKWATRYTTWELKLAANSLVINPDI